MRKKAKPFSWLADVPADPKRVLKGTSETPWEVSARTGLDHRKVCEAIERWAKQGSIVLGLLEGAGCQVPVVRLRQAWDR